MALHGERKGSEECATGDKKVCGIARPQLEGNLVKKLFRDGQDTGHDDGSWRGEGMAEKSVGYNPALQG